MFKLVAFALFALFALSFVNSAPIPHAATLAVRDTTLSEIQADPSFNLAQPRSDTDTSDPSSNPDSDDDCEDDDNDDDEIHDGGDDSGDDDCGDEPSSPAPSSTPTSLPSPSESPESNPSPAPSPSSSDSPAPSPSPTQNSTPSDSTAHTDADLTWFTQDGNAGACGIVHSDSDFIAALDSRTYGDSGSQSSLCGKQIRISWQGKSVDVTVADDCPTCNTPSSVDLSQAAFEALSSLDTGLLTGASWVLL